MMWDNRAELDPTEMKTLRTSNDMEVFFLEQKAKKFYKKAPRLLLWTVRTDKEKDFARKNADNMIFELTNPYDWFSCCKRK